MRLTVAIFAGIVLVLGASFACGGGGGGGSKEEKQELADLAVKLAKTDGAAATQDEIDFWMGHVTDTFVQEFGTDSVAACAESAADCIGDPLTRPAVDTDTVDIDKDKATLTIATDDGNFGLDFVKEADVWKASGLFAVDDLISQGVEKVDVELQEFAFVFNADDPLVKGGRFAFDVKNGGQQTHEVIVMKIPEDANIDDLLQSEDPAAAGAEFITFKFPWKPGDQADMRIPTLASGRYLLACFLPDTTDPEKTPHAFKGMTAEFHVD